jgi:hypothetical protein
VVGENCSLNAGASTIGRVTSATCPIAAYVVLVGENHVFDDLDVLIAWQGLTSEGADQDDVWIGAHVTVVDGVMVGAQRDRRRRGGDRGRRRGPSSGVRSGPCDRRRAPTRKARQPRPAPLIAGPLRRDVVDQWPTCWLRGTTGSGAPVDRPGAGRARPLNDGRDRGAFGAAGHRTRDELVERIQVSDPSPDCCGPERGPGRRTPEADRSRKGDVGILSAAAEAGPGRRTRSTIESCTANEPQGWLDRLDWGLGPGPRIGATPRHGRRAQPPPPRLDGPRAALGWPPPATTGAGEWATRARRRLRRGVAHGGERLLPHDPGLRQFGVDLPNPEAATTTVLAHCRRWDWFRREERNACNLLDIVHPLLLPGRQNDHRREIRDGIAACSTMPSPSGSRVVASHGTSVVRLAGAPGHRDVALADPPRPRSSASDGLSGDPGGPPARTRRPSGTGVSSVDER